jgi:predicted Zn-dependent protease
MSITVHYLEAETVNAFATLGGHIVFFRGLRKSPEHGSKLKANR